MWQPQLDAVPEGWRFIAPDLPGFGETDASRAQPGHAGESAGSIDDYAADVIDLIDHLHIDTAVIGGVSMGGYVAFAMFRLAPRYVAGLVLADTRPQADTEEGRAGRRTMIDAVEKEGAPAVARLMLPRLISDETARTQPAVGEALRVMMESATPGAIQTAIRHLMSRPDSTPDLDDIHCPTLIIVGEEDALTPVADSQVMHRRIRGSILEIVLGAGHMASLERPGIFNAALVNFLTTRL